MTRNARAPHAGPTGPTAANGRRGGAKDGEAASHAAFVAGLLEVAELLRQKAALRVQRLELQARRTAWRALLALWLAFAVAIATVAAVVLLLRGTATALGAWLERPWAGDLAAGALFFAAAALAAAMFGARTRRRQLARITRRFGAPGDGMDVAPRAAARPKARRSS